MFKRIKRNFNNKRFVTVITFVLIAMLSVGLITTMVKLDKSTKTETYSSFYYEGGSISTTTGKSVSSDSALRSKGFISADGLEVDLKTDATVNYQIFFYDVDEEFIEATAVKTVDFTITGYEVTATGKTSEDIEYARIVIAPISNVAVNVTNIYGYANQVTVSYSK